MSEASFGKLYSGSKLQTLTRSSRHRTTSAQPHQAGSLRPTLAADPRQNCIQGRDASVLLNCEITLYSELRFVTHFMIGHGKGRPLRAGQLKGSLSSIV